MTTPADTNPSILLHGPKRTSISTTYLPFPTLSSYPPDHVLLKIAYVGVCGSDVHFWTHGGIGADHRKYAQYFTAQTAPVNSTNDEHPFAGLVMGHEATATVLETGQNVQNLTVGDNVAIEPGGPCRECARCVEGMYNLCPGMRFAASFYESEQRDGEGNAIMRATPGTLCKYYVLPEQLCYKLPAHIGLDEGVLVEPMAVAVHAVRLAGVGLLPRDGGTVVVMGAGTIGVVSAAVACAFGASRVVLCDVNDSRLGFAERWLGEGEGAAKRAGATVSTFCVDPAEASPTEATRLNEEHNLGLGVDVVLEASGVPSSTALGIYVLRPGGNMVQTGLSKKPLMNDFPITDLSEKEIHFHGAFRYKEGDFEVARNLLARGLVGPVKELINHVFAFEDFESAWKATADGKGIKNLIRGPD
ncbi:hypothetical protein PMZ80_007529 [Knufia obscura]|nr:hypothetical protein PMZ80_007529 [Knufia obscura]